MVSNDPESIFKRACANAARAKWGDDPCNERMRLRTMQKLLQLRHLGVHTANLTAIALGQIPWPSH